MKTSCDKAANYQEFAALLAKTETTADLFDLFLGHLDLIEQANARLVIGSQPSRSWRQLALGSMAKLAGLMVARRQSEDAKAVYERRWSHHGAKSHRKRLLKPRDYLIGDRIHSISEGTFSVLLTQTLIALFKQFVQQDDGVVVELGCGNGRNLFVIRSLFPSVECIGVDISNAGPEFASAMAQQLDADRMTFLGDIDITDGALMAPVGAMLRGRSVVVMTIGCLEVVPDTGRAIEQILALKPRCVIHFEPVLELLTGAFPSRDYFARRHLIAGGYMTSLLTILEQDERIEIVARRRAGLGKALLEYSVLVWKPKSSG
jgi:SAM-dependent methyltransferase